MEFLTTIWKRSFTCKLCKLPTCGASSSKLCNCTNIDFEKARKKALKAAKEKLIEIRREIMTSMFYDYNLFKQNRIKEINEVLDLLEMAEEE